MGIKAALNRSAPSAISLAVFTTLVIGHPAPARSGVLDQAPVDQAVLHGDYRRIANCSYERLDKVAGAGLKKVDLDGSTRLALESGSVRYWELVFRATGKGETRVELAVVETMWGPSNAAKGVMQEVRACGG